jgi:voltage-gated potassium channel
MLLTTIGSQFWPVTTEGRALAFLLSLYGLAVLGYLTATFASFFIGRDAEEENGPVAGSAELQALKAVVSALRRAIERANAGGSVAGPTPPA